MPKQLPEARTGHDQTHTQRQIDATDRQIDKLVHELYGLTEENIFSSFTFQTKCFSV